MLEFSFSPSFSLFFLSNCVCIIIIFLCMKGEEQASEWGDSKGSSEDKGKPREEEREPRPGNGRVRASPPHPPFFMPIFSALMISFPDFGWLSLPPFLLHPHNPFSLPVWVHVWMCCIPFFFFGNFCPFFLNYSPPPPPPRCCNEESHVHEDCGAHLLDLSCAIINPS